MIKYNITLLKELENNNLENVYISPIWLMKVEKIFHKGSFFLKTYLFKNLSDISIDEVTFRIKYSEKEVIIKVNEIKRAESYPTDPIYGCLIQLPEDYKDVEYKITVIGLVIDAKIIDFSDETQNVLDFSSYSLDSKNSYLRKYLPDYLLFPQIKSNYWQCSCGEYNSKNNEKCLNCGNVVSNINDMIQKGIDILALEIYLKDNPIEFNHKLNFETAYKEYISKLITDISLSDDSIKSLIDKEKEEVIYKEKLELYNKKKNKNKFRAIIAAVLIAFSLYIYNYGPQTVTYTSGIVNYMTGNYEAAVTDFNKIKNFVNSSNMVLQVKYSWAKSLNENNSEASIKKLEEIINLDFKDSNDLYNEYVYSYATTLFNDGEYESSAEYFNKVEFEDSSTMYLESEYLLAKEYYASNNFYSKAIEAMKIAKEENYKDSASIYNEWIYLKGTEYFESKRYSYAIDTFKEIIDYKDSKDLYNESTYLYGKSLMSVKNYSSAISYFSKISSYKDSATQIKESNYQIALDFYKDKSYQSALTYFNQVKGYRDANSKIYAIEEIIYAWSVKIYFNSSENSASDYSSISRYSAVYIHFELNGGRPGASTYLKYTMTLPDGTVYTQTTNFALYDGGSYWTGWADGLYYTPAYGTTGDLKISIYDANTGKFLGSDSVYISR